MDEKLSFSLKLCTQTGVWVQAGTQRFEHMYRTFHSEKNSAKLFFFAPIIVKVNPAVDSFNKYNRIPVMI